MARARRSGFQEWEKISADGVPLEEMREAVSAIMKHLDIALERQKHFYGGVEYRAVPASPRNVQVLPTPHAALTTKKTFEAKSEIYGADLPASLREHRRPGVIGFYTGWLPGCGGDVWIVEHEDSTVAAYLYSEVDLTFKD